MFFYEYSEIFKNNYFEEQQRTAATANGCYCFTLFSGFFVLLGHIRFRCVLSIFRRHKSKCKTRLQLVIRDYSFSTYPKLSKKNISYPLTRTCAYQSVSNVSFSENFAYFLNGLHAFL